MMQMMTDIGSSFRWSRVPGDIHRTIGSGAFAFSCVDDILDLLAETVLLDIFLNGHIVSRLERSGL